MAQRRGDATTTSTVRWGIPDALLCYLAGFVGVVVLASIAAAVSGTNTATERDDSALVYAAAFAGQYGGTLLALVAVSRRKGRGNLTDDFGLRIWVGDWWVVPMGAGLGALLGALLLPLSNLANGREQEVVQELNDASGAKLVVLAIGAGLLAPVVEELVFRGLLLRALLRRMPATAAVAVSAVSFALVHFGDPSLGTVVAMPALVTIGVVAGVFTVRTGDLSRAIMLHAGFNLLTILQVALT
jgi:membrane protease YdiL (CAAX protease family)